MAKTFCWVELISSTPAVFAWLLPENIRKWAQISEVIRYIKLGLSFQAIGFLQTCDGIDAATKGHHSAGHL